MHTCNTVITQSKLKKNLNSLIRLEAIDLVCGADYASNFKN